MQGEEVTTVSRDKSFQEVCLSWQWGERERERAVSCTGGVSVEKNSACKLVDSGSH